MKLRELLSERERAAAYGLHGAVALIDAEIERLKQSADSAPVNRKAPERATAIAEPASKSQTRRMAA